MTYQDYLETWKNMFGDEPTGEYGYYQRSQRVPYPVHRLTEEEFNQHLEALKKSNDAFQAAVQANDDKGMDDALLAGLKHELALLI